jgi:hypothetical protein
VPIISLYYSTGTSRHKFDQSTNTILRNSPSFLLKSLLQFLQSFRRWLTTAHASIQVIHKSSIGFKSSDLNGQGSTVTFWLARKSTVARAVCDRVLSCRKASLRRFIAGSICGVKTSSLYRAALRFPWMCTSWVFRRRIWHPTSSHFLRQNCRPQGRSSLWTSNSDVCWHVYRHLFSAAWIFIHRWTRLASSFAGHRPLLCCAIGPLQVDADVSVLRQSKDVLPVRTFSRRQFLTVCADIRLRPGTFDAVSLAVTARFLRWSTRM